MALSTEELIIFIVVGSILLIVLIIVMIMQIILLVRIRRSSKFEELDEPAPYGYVIRRDSSGKTYREPNPHPPIREFGSNIPGGYNPNIPAYYKIDDPDYPKDIVEV